MRFLTSFVRTPAQRQQPCVFADDKLAFGVRSIPGRITVVGSITKIGILGRLANRTDRLEPRKWRDRRRLRAGVLKRLRSRTGDAHRLWWRRRSDIRNLRFHF